MLELHVTGPTNQSQPDAKFVMEKKEKKKKEKEKWLPFKGGIVIIIIYSELVWQSHP